MLVEDQPAIRHWLSWCFRGLSGYAPLLVYSRSQACAWLSAASPWERIADVVLIDVSVPGQTLAPLLGELRASRTEAKHAPVIIGMTTMPKGYYPQMPEGLRAMLYKPFPFRLLCALLADCLDNQG
jgi:DNA-binding response OmpR family regulator